MNYVDVLSAGFPATPRSEPYSRPWQEVENASGYAAQLRSQPGARDLRTSSTLQAPPQQQREVIEYNIAPQ